MGRSATLLFAAFLLAIGCAPRAAGVRAVERFDAEVHLHPDGSMEVREQILIRADPAVPAVFERRIGSEQTDGFVDVSALIGDRPAGGSGTPDQVTVDSGSRLTVQWRLPASPEPSHILELRYRALGVVEIQGMRGTVSWPVLPALRQYEIGSARVSLTVPPGTRVLTPPTLDSPGWQWTKAQDVLVATKSPIASSEPGILHSELALDAVPMIEPRWQTRAALGQQLTPSFIAAGLFILVTGGGILWAIHLRYFQSSATPEDARLTQRREVARGLRAAGVVVVALGLLTSAVCYALLRSIGPWPQAVPVSLVLVGLWFVLTGRVFAKRS